MTIRPNTGDQFTFDLTLPGLDVQEPVRTMTWYGRAQTVQFGVIVPRHRKPGTVPGTVMVAQRGVPIGHIKFVIEIKRVLLKRKKLQPRGSQARRYGKAFISYAAKDRREVLKRVQMLQLLQIQFFQDLLQLDPGERWERRLYKEIETCDIFLLFWSAAARQSTWVAKEIRYALDRKGGDGLAAPEIIPVLIEGPPPIPPPDELAHLHFNDRTLYFMMDSAG